MNHYLYKITVGGKSYIGVSVNTTQRFEAHCKSRYLIGIAIREWGRALADFRVLACGSMEYIYNLEVEAIRAFGTLTPNGYNIARGGLPGHRHLNPKVCEEIEAGALARSIIRDKEKQEKQLARDKEK